MRAQSVINPRKDDVTRDDFQRRFLVQHWVQMLEQCCSLSKRCRNNVVTLCCAKNRRCKPSRVTLAWGSFRRVIQDSLGFQMPLSVELGSRIRMVSRIVESLRWIPDSTSQDSDSTRKISRIRSPDYLTLGGGGESWRNLTAPAA